MIIKYIQKEPLLIIFALLACVSMVIIPPDQRYTGYIDLKTLACLFCLMVSLKGMEREGVLTAVSAGLAARMKSLRGLAFLLVFLCFFAAELMTNDVALIALVPITLTVLRICGLKKYSALLVILQTLAANIGSSLTPIGNPQNLFLFMRYRWELGDFLLCMLPFVLLGGLLLALVCVFLPGIPLAGGSGLTSPEIHKKPVAAYGLMFAVSVAAVFAIVAATAIVDRKTLAKVDYSLLLTFMAIFVLVGNLARIGVVNELLTSFIRRDTLLTAIVTSQFISNVPAAVMLSGFTDQAGELLMGVNAGGMGTLIASMASVISYKLFAASDKKGALRYLGLFTAVNAAFLVISTFFVYMIR